MDKRAVVVLPNQLFDKHPCIDSEDKTTEIFLVEEGRYFTDFNFHKKKLIFHRASMKWYEARLKEDDHPVRYIEYSVDWRDCIAGYDVTMAEFYDNKLKESIPEDITITGSPAFIGGGVKKKKKYLMGNYYREQRKRLNILIKDDGKPVGGKWSFDSDNRKKLPRDHTCPEIKVYMNAYIEEATAYVLKNFKDNPGEYDNFIYPVTHRDALKWLEDFIDERLSLFGDYEDAIASEEDILYHSLLSPLLNSGLLTPMEVVERVLVAPDIPLNCIEGFIRQIIGWREFILQIYLIEGETERRSNFFNNTRKLPEGFYTGSTGMEPVDNAIKKVLKNAYNHHIERLMILGNYMLLKEYDPDEVYRWFMEMYIDAYDWVMVPNIYGMSQFADGGLFATKPYISSSNYILKMSDFKRGQWCEDWSDLYWRFLEKHQDKLRDNPRMGLMMSQLDKRKEKK